MHRLMETLILLKLSLFAMSEEHVFLSLGSNMGDRYQNLIFGIGMLNDHPHIWVTERSHVYQSAPMYNADQDEFYNMVIEIDTNLTPLDLLNEIKSIEKRLGRKTIKKKNMPRVLDIDILTIGSLQIHSGLLEIPHPAISERRFVLKPWNDIAPKFKVPGHNSLVSEILESTDDNSEVRMVLILDKKGMS